ncbi:MAG: hypothetical protein KAI97_08465, partial [Gemmatimonadetes bacterium]|nr:hypothetical protein [Gemmatimonadota bacterium]
GLDAEQGFYHRRHFENLPQKPTLAARWARLIRDRVLSRRDSTRILADTPSVLVVYNGADDSIVIYFLAEAAEIRFHSYEAWSTFHSCLLEIASSDWSGEWTRDCGGGYLWASESPTKARLSWLEEVSKTLRLRRADYETIQGELGGEGDVVDFGTAIGEKGIEPVAMTGTPASQVGRVKHVVFEDEVAVIEFTAVRDRAITLARSEVGMLAGLADRINKF